MGLKLRLLWLSLIDFLLAPFRYRERLRREAREHELAIARIQAEAQTEGLKGMTSAMERVVSEMASVTKEQSKVLQEWLAGFRTFELPTTLVVREEDEVAREMARRGLTFPEGIDTAQKQLEWLHAEIDKDVQ